MTTPTSNPVPSNDPRDLLFNAGVLDAAVNSPELQFADRKGAARLTIAGATNLMKVVNPRGAWATGTLYQPRDLVSNSGTWYIALDTHTAGASFAGDQAAHWAIHQGVLASDLANSSSATKGAGLMAYGPSKPYAAGSVGAKLRERISVSDYADLTFTAAAKDLGDPASHIATSFTSWRLAIQAALDEAASRPGGADVIIDGGQAPFAQSVLLVDDHFIIKGSSSGSVCVKFLAEVQLADYTTVGGIIDVQGDNVVIENPRVNGSNIFAGGSGENGIAPTEPVNNLKVFGGHIRNLARGNAGGKFGGKAFQFEDTYDLVTVDGTSISNCFMAMSAFHDFAATSPCGPLVFTGMTVRDCGILLFVRQAGGRDTSGQSHSVVLDGFEAINCGTFQGLMQFSRASNVSVSNGLISNATSIDSVIRGNVAFSSFKDLEFAGDCSQIVNLDPSDYAVDSSYAQENNRLEIKHRGTTGYVLNSSIGTPYRTWQDCEVTAHLQNDVTTKIVGDELRNGYCVINAQQGNKSFSASAADLYTRGITNFAALPSGISLISANVPAMSANATGSPLTFTDNSGAGLVFATNNGDFTKIGRMVFVSFNITFPATASGTANKIGGLPVPAINVPRGAVGLALRITDFGAAISASVNANTSEMVFVNSSGAILTNSQLSGKTVSGMLTYMANQ